MVSLGWVGPEPARHGDENRRWVSIPYTTLGQVPAHPSEAMISIKPLQLTGLAYRLSGE